MQLLSLFLTVCLTNVVLTSPVLTAGGDEDGQGAFGPPGSASATELLAGLEEPDEEEILLLRGEVDGSHHHVADHRLNPNQELDLPLLTPFLLRKLLQISKLHQDAVNNKRSHYKQCAFNAVSCFG